MKNQIMEIKNLSVGYSINAPLIGAINLVLNRSEIIGIKGRNGIGKSTFAKGILGLVKIFSGNINILNKDITKWNYQKIGRLGLIGYLPQKDRIFGNLSVGENLEISYSFQKRKKNYKSIIKNSLTNEMFEVLANNYDSNASILSGGEILLLSLACINLFAPPIILLDEATDNLDPKNKSFFKNLIIQWKADGKGIIIIEQDTKILESVSDKIYTMQEIANEIYPYTLK